MLCFFRKYFKTNCYIFNCSVLSLVWQEEEKSKLSITTGLDQKQINNWFINQRKRHWKPPEDMRFVLMDGVGAGECMKGSNFYDNGETGSHVIWHIDLGSCLVSQILAAFEFLCVHFLFFLFFPFFGYRLGIAFWVRQKHMSI